MKALTWHGKRDVRVDTVPDPTIEQPTDAIIRVTSTGPVRLRPAPLRGARPVHRRGRRPRPRADGRRRGGRRRGRRTSPSATASSIPFNISCGHCFMCEHGLQSQCETTQVRDQGMGAALFGYTKLYGAGARRPGRVPARPAGPVRADQGPRRPAGRPLPVPLRRPADGLAGGASTPRSPTAAASPCIGLGPIGEMSTPDRPAPRRRAGDRARPRARAARALAGATACETIDVSAVDDVPEARARAHRRPRAGRGHRRRRHGGARRAGRQARPHARRADARRGRAQGDGERPASTASAR